MIGPHPHGHSGDVRPKPSGSTFWWSVRAIAVVATMLLSCVAFTGVIEATGGSQCHELTKRECFALVIDHLTGTTPPARPSGD